MYSARGIAEWFTAWAEEQEADVSNLKIQKLLYYAQGEYFAKKETPLFRDRIEAWAHGPVVESVYRDLKKFGRNPIEPDQFIDPNFEWSDYREIEQFLIDIWDRYAIYSAWALREKTHQESPWKDAFVPNRNVEITTAALKSHFGR